jgi:hypothetical protein
MLKEHMADVIDELVSVSKRHNIKKLIEKFDIEATKEHCLMQQAQEDMITMQMTCFNTICDVLTGNNNSDVVGNDQNQEEQWDAEAQVVNDNVQQTSNAAMEAPLPADAHAYNDQGTKQTKSPTQSPRQEVSPASQSRPEI